ncbi:MAG: hypothetical protein A2X36_05690 [Elusimicrobia bacterium GWA2_69_24]|nr:MAG: hypothetical protein A2W08_09385 [Candidatus Rokubacteria bacterium RBG_16_73_20]OGR57630.1 MAG: hypothetical protein A2X36_05690 [Elusimicrobia bacterium GWA2_69_24]
MLRKRRRLVLAVTLLVVAVVAIATAMQEPVYLASARVLVDRYRIDPLQQIEIDRPDMTNFYETQFELIRSRPVIQRAIDGLQLATRRPGLAGAPDPAKAVLGGVKVEVVRGTRLVDIRVEDGDPVFAADLANAIANGFVRHVSDLRLEGSRNAYEYLTNEVKNMKDSLNRAEMALGRYKEEHQLILLPQRANAAASKMSDFHAAYVDAQTRRLELEAQLRTVREGGPNSAALEAKSEALAGLRAQEAAAQTELNNLLKTYKDKHPAVVRARAQLDDIRARLKTEHGRVFQALEGQYKIQKAREAAMLQAFERYKKETQDLARKEVQFNVLQREATVGRDMLDFLIKRLRETGLSSELNTNTVRVAEAATVPTFPIRPRRLQNLLMGLLAGLVGGLVIAFVLEFAEDSVQNPDDVAQLLGAPLLGTVPVLQAVSPSALKDAPDKARHRLVETDGADTRAVESLNLIGVALRSDSNGSLPRRILVTSATPQEGKSTIAANLAVTLARLGTRVLLVDTDLRHPTLDRFFGVRTPSDIGEAARRGTPLGEAVRPTAVPGLSLLPVGRVTGSPLALIKSAYFSAQLDALAEEFDLILFDSPPITLVADSMALAPLTEGIVLVVRHGHGSQWRLRKMVGQLDRIRVPVLGFVYDGYTPRDDKHYSYYYGAPRKRTSRGRAGNQTVGRGS